MIADPDEYDSLNELEVGNYIKRHYIEKEGLRIDFLSEGEEDDCEVEEVEMGHFSNWKIEVLELQVCSRWEFHIPGKLSEPKFH